MFTFMVLALSLLWFVQDGNSPLHIAAIKGHISTVSILLQAGAAIDYHNQV